MSVIKKRKKSTITKRALRARRCLAGIWLIGTVGINTTAMAETAIERGRYLTSAGGCLSCHTDSENEGELFAGGHPLETDFGTFIVPNITPDMRTGIGSWGDTEFVNALLHGESPTGEYYYPAFPYPSYAGMRRQDALDIKAYLDTLEPVSNEIGDHDLNWYVPGRWSMAVWQALFSPWEFNPIAKGASESIQRGAYLVRHLGHCGECHTPRNIVGAMLTEQELQGVPKRGEIAGAPDITNNTETGLGEWSNSDLELFLDLGMMPDGDFAGSGMAAVIDHNTSQLTTADRQAIVNFLRSIAVDPED
jgi:mono/diheme cytochrome c family protein